MRQEGIAVLIPWQEGSVPGMVSMFVNVMFVNSMFANASEFVVGTLEIPDRYADHALFLHILLGTGTRVGTGSTLRVSVSEIL
jgi:hypothetical protein